MNCFISSLNDLINECNAIAYELVEFLMKNGFIDKVNTDVYSFKTELNSIDLILCDGEYIANSILEYYVKEYSKYEFNDVFVKGMPYFLNETFGIELGLPCLNLAGTYKGKKNLLLYWYSIFFEYNTVPVFASISTALSAVISTPKDAGSSSI